MVRERKDGRAAAGPNPAVGRRGAPAGADGVVPGAIFRVQEGANQSDRGADGDAKLAADPGAMLQIAARTALRNCRVRSLRGAAKISAGAPCSSIRPSQKKQTRSEMSRANSIW